MGSCRLSGCLFHQGILDPIGLAAEQQESSVMDDSVDDGGGHGVIAEYGSPAGELEVGGDDQATFLVAVGDELEQEPWLPRYRSAGSLARQSMRMSA